MKITLRFKEDSNFKGVTEIIECLTIPVATNGMLNLNGRNLFTPVRSINLDQISQWYISEDVVFDTKTEEYLHENLGNLNKYYESVTDGYNAGRAFAFSISRPDSYRIKRDGKWESVISEKEFDGPSILEAIEFLETTKKDYPEDHPLWSLR